MRLQKVSKNSSECCKELTAANKTLQMSLQELPEDNLKLNFQHAAEDNNTASGKEFLSDEPQHEISMNGNGHEHEMEEESKSHESFSLVFSKDKVEELHADAYAEYLQCKGEDFLQGKTCDYVLCSGSSPSAKIEDQCSCMTVPVSEKTDGKQQDFKLRGEYFSTARSGHCLVKQGSQIFRHSLLSYCI